MIETWKEVDGFNKYKISIFGRIFSKLSNKILKPQNNKGYYQIRIRNNNNTECTQKIHRLVARAFIPNSEDKPFINHIDNNGLNNYISNLEWCTPKENSMHAAKCGRFHNNDGINHRKISQYNLDGMLIQTFNSVNEAANYLNIHPSSISRILTGKRKQLRKHIYKYYDNT